MCRTAPWSRACRRGPFEERHSMEKIVFQAEPRKELGTRAARRIRARGLLPANIYGHGDDQILVSIDAKEFTKFLDAGHRIVTVRVDGKEERSVVKEVQ